MEGFELRPGQVVELELSKSENEVLQFRTLVEEQRDSVEYTLLAPMYKGMPYPFHSRDTVDLIYTVHDEESKPHVFTFKARTEERLWRGELSYLKIVRISEVTKLQRRGFYRLNYVADMPFLLLDEELEAASEPRIITTRDISAGGMRGVIVGPPAKGSLLQIHLELGDETLEVKGRIIDMDRQKDSTRHYDVRIAFIGQTTRDIGALVQAINRMQSEYIRRMAGTSLEERLALYGHDELLFTERRRGKDWVLRWLDWSVVATWLMTFVIIVNYLRAMPERPNIIDHYYGYRLRLDWDIGLIRSNIYLLTALFVLTSVSIVLNATRMKREGDHYRLSLIIMAAVCLVLLVIYMVAYR